MTAIGATFAAELSAAGVPANGISWGSDGTLSFDPAISPATVALVQQVKAAHDPTKQSPAALLAQLVAQKTAAGYNDTATGHNYPLDQVSLDHLTAEGATALAAITSNGVVAWDPAYQFLMADGAKVPMTAVQCLQFSQRVRNYARGLIVNAAVLAKLIAQGGTPDITQGWPVNQ